MATTTTKTTSSNFLKPPNHPNNNNNITKPKRRKCRETTISTSASTRIQLSEPDSQLPDSPSPNYTTIRYSPGTFSPIMDHFTHSSSPISGQDPFPSSFTKFNSALTAGLLNPMSPPPDKTRSSPTLFEMMVNEPDIHQRTNQIPNNIPTTSSSSIQKPQIVVQDRETLMMHRISELLSASRSPGNHFNDSSSSDIKLTLSSKDGFSVSMNVHRQILVAHSRFFSVKLSDRWTQQQPRTALPYLVEIADCDDVEVYVETLRLMYCKDLRKKLMKEDVSKVLGILKVSAAIGFDAGVLSCLEYLEAAPWAEDEEDKVASLFLVSKMLHENSSQNDLRKESLYSACDDCMQLLRHHFLRAADSDLQDVSQIARQADNLYWILDILIDRQIAEDFLKAWASESELSEAHSKVPAVHRFEVSRVTARLFVGIGKGQLLASKDARCLLLKTWLVPFYDDFGWMRRASKGLDRHLIEDGLSNTILTLPLSWQQEILLAWFNRFLNSGEDCPNIQRGFEVWWRRAFWKRNGEHDRTRQLRITSASIEHT
ncbi:hypothetical protein TSUD_76520 [Trifolium subterraneum]|uniref:BTB domain-containing protein n=1 Tax=Trifolium subterraneum TaxID=3900 RepID=A0A2Z6MAN3_TRISU|nr:hypothetical protein TSUD_76520 [Trifolium subterraneum]